MLYEFASPCFVGYSSLHFSRDPWQFSGHHGIWEDTDTDAQVGAYMHAGYCCALLLRLISLSNISYSIFAAI